MKSTATILIVGAGPTGLTLACALAKQDIQSRIIDKRLLASPLPRAINISNSTLKIFTDLNIGDGFLEDGLKLSDLTVYWNKKRLINVNYKHINVVYPYFFHLNQLKVEQYLEELLSKFKIKIERGITIDKIYQQGKKLLAYTTDADHVVDYKEYSYIIGCDGGNSSVGKIQGISYQYEKYDSYFMLCDAAISHPFTSEKLRYYLTDEGYLILVPLPEGKYRIIASFKGDFLKHYKFNLDVFQKAIDERGPGNVHIRKIYWSTISGFYQKLANQAKKGNVFLAGDALHQFSPVGGTNMNTGIQDAFILAKKITSVIKNINEEKYLESYQIERMKAAKKIRNATCVATYLMTREKILPKEENKYLPQMKNRNFIKFNLPNLFSGKI